MEVARSKTFTISNVEIQILKKITKKISVQTIFHGLKYYFELYFVELGFTRYFIICC